MKVFITRKLPGNVEKLFRQKGIQVKVYQKDKPIPPSELIKEAKNADGLIPLLTDRIDRKFIDKLTKCKVIANYAVGYNNIDVAYAKSKGIIVTNTPDILTNATADLTMALILSCARRIPESDQFTRKRKFKGWKPQLLLGIELGGKTLGILGAGRIGRETAHRAKAFGMKIIYYDTEKNIQFEIETGAVKVSLNSLLKKSDVISVHLPLNDKTHHILNHKNLIYLKRSAIIINTARGEIIEENALISFLKKEKIFSAGLDVYENEPNLNKEFYKLSNVILLPHIGSATIEARTGMAELAAKNVLNVLTGKDPITPV